jgi:anti-sigma-K factor RskA
MPLIEDLPDEAPPAHVWDRLQSRLGWTPRAGRTGLWHNLSFWRWAGLTSFVAACALAVGLTQLLSSHNATEPAANAQYLVATLARQGGGAGWTATVDAEHGQIVIVPPQGFTTASNQSTEMWMIPPGSKPISLGVIDAQHPTVIRVAQPKLPMLKAQITLAVSLEPHGGSPTGQPTGPVLAAGPTEGI